MSAAINQGAAYPYNDICYVVLKGDICRSSMRGTVETNDIVFNDCDILQSNTYIKKTVTCNDATCCLYTVCANDFGSCTNLSYQTTFSGVLSDGVIAGIVLG